MIKDVEPLLKECEETLKELMKMGNMEVACYVQGFINSINKLPNAEEKPQGKWLTEDNFDRLTHTAVCSNCRLRQSFIMTSFPFCPNCGAKMRTEE